MKTREQIDLALIDDNPWQPRVAMDPEGVEELADSIAALGLLQAPLARRDTIRDRYQLAFGHRRVAACRLLHQQGRGESYIDMDVAEISNEEMAVIALAENVRRKDLSQIEVVRAHKRAIEEAVGRPGCDVRRLRDQEVLDWGVNFNGPGDCGQPADNGRSTPGRCRRPPRAVGSPGQPPQRMHPNAKRKQTAAGRITPSPTAKRGSGTGVTKRRSGARR